MTATVQQICNLLEKLAPRYLAEKWDNVGLQVGNPCQKVNRILVTLDITEEVLNEASDKDVDMIISHHPLIFEPLKKIHLNTWAGKILRDILCKGFAVYACHTNLDAGKDGLNSWLAERLGLVHTEILKETFCEDLNKLVVFVPKGFEDKVMNAMAATGAGWIGKYSHCTFQTRGTGTFKPLSGAVPFIGDVGRLERVEEVRIETIMENYKTKDIVSAMLKCHPYEEVAYDIYPLKNRSETVHGLGRIGQLEKEETLDSFLKSVKERLNVKNLRIVSENMEQKVKKVAVCGGAGASLIHVASTKKADLFLTGDIKYHDALKARELGLILVDAGHSDTEKVMLEGVKRYLLKEFKEKGFRDMEVLESECDAELILKY